MSEFNVTVIIENKPGISDPEGETILNDLVLKSKNSSVKKIRSGKILRFTMVGNDIKSVEKKVAKICDELRIFNPCLLYWFSREFVTVDASVSNNVVCSFGMLFFVSSFSKLLFGMDVPSLRMCSISIPRLDKEYEIRKNL